MSLTVKTGRPQVLHLCNLGAKIQIICKLANLLIIKLTNFAKVASCIGGKLWQSLQRKSDYLSFSNLMVSTGVLEWFTKSLLILPLKK